MQSRTFGFSLAVGMSVMLAAASPAQQPAVPTAEAAPALAVSAPAAEPLEAGQSQVRIVRLSQTRGVVEMDRNTGRGFEAAFANIPVVAGVTLRTARGVAEVEFEDNSTLRLAPDSEIVFSRLSRGASGSTQNTITLTHGLLYVSLEKTPGAEFVVRQGGATIKLQPAAHLRLAAQGDNAELALFNGSAVVQLGSAEELVPKKHTLTLNSHTDVLSPVSGSVEATDWDDWDKQGADYHKLRANLAGSGGYGLYGVNDLNYYGSFADLPGCGNVWRPYFASAAWDPFAIGTWAWFPAGGYSWVSPYPWGWLPFHSGAWTSCGNAGWGWRPGGSWYGLQNREAMRIAHRPLPRPTPPLPGHPTLVPVNAHPVPISGMTAEDRFAFRRDSAGLGVPRTNFGNLHHLDGQVERRGLVSSGGVTNTVAGPMHINRADNMILPGRDNGEEAAAVRRGGVTEAVAAARSNSTHTNSGAAQAWRSGSASSSSARSASNSASSSSFASSAATHSMSTSAAPAASSAAHK